METNVSESKQKDEQEKKTIQPFEMKVTIIYHFIKYNKTLHYHYVQENSAFQDRCSDVNGLKITSSIFSKKLSKKIKKGSYANKKVRNLLIAILHLLPVNQ